jgi:DNA-binding GntR family transcriptional regulator
MHGTIQRPQRFLRKHRPNLADKAYVRLEELIATLELEPGGVVSEGALSKQLGIGRTPLREALQRLAAQGLLVALPRKGLMISEINVAEQLGILETRRVVDRLIATNAAERATQPQRTAFASLASLMQKTSRTRDIREFMQLDRRFDLLADAASRNPSASQAAAALHIHGRRLWYLYQHDSDLTRAVRLHVTLIQTIAAGNSRSAAEASDSLIDYLSRVIRGSLDVFGKR